MAEPEETRELLQLPDLWLDMLARELSAKRQGWYPSDRWALFATCKAAARVVMRASDRRKFTAEHLPTPCCRKIGDPPFRKRSMAERAEVISGLMALSPEAAPLWAFDNCHMYPPVPVCLPERVEHLTVTHRMRDVPWPRLTALTDLCIDDVDASAWQDLQALLQCAQDPACLPKLRSLHVGATEGDFGDESEVPFSWLSTLEGQMMQMARAPAIGGRITTLKLSTGVHGQWLDFAWLTSLTKLTHLHLTGSVRYTTAPLRAHPSLREITLNSKVVLLLP